MDIVKKIFGRFMALLFVCTSTLAIAQNSLARKYDLPDIYCVNAKLPITFSWINYEDPDKDVPAIVAEKIQKIIVDFYLESDGGDSEELFKAKDCYFNTICAPLGNLQLYTVILKTPLSYTHCKLFLYDSVSNSVSKNVVDYNTWAMYIIDENSMKRSDLYKDLHLNSDDIILKKQSNLLLKRLKHNGTSNELEEITYRPNGVSLDTATYKSEPLLKE